MIPSRTEAKREIAGRQKDPAGPEHSPGLSEGREAVFSARQVIKRPEKQDGLGALVGPRERAGVADDGFDERRRRSGRRSRSGHVDVQRNDIEEPDPVAILGQPERVDAGPAADIVDDRRSRRQEPGHELAGPHELELAAPGPQSGGFDPRPIIPFNVRHHSPLSRLRIFVMISGLT